MAEVLSVMAAFAAALGLLGAAVALWMFLDRLRMRRKVQRGERTDLDR